LQWRKKFVQNTTISEGSTAMVDLTLELDLVTTDMATDIIMAMVTTDMTTDIIMAMDTTDMITVIFMASHLTDAEVI
jgi:hypothetical protein